MRMSPGSRWGKRSAIVLSTTAAGTINHTARGLSSFAANSCSPELPTAVSRTSLSTAFGDISKTTHWRPPFKRRRTMFAPMRPSPTIPSCIRLLLEFPVSADQTVRRAVVTERGLCLALELRDDALRQHLPKLHAPLVERVDLPDHALRKHRVLV